MTSHALRAAIGMFGLIVLAGCSVPVSGGAIPVGTGPGSSSLPPGPREIRIDDLDPCTVFTTDQLQILEVGRQQFTPASGSGGPLCQWSSSANSVFEGYLVERITDSGPEFAFGNRRGTTVITVAGFPAIQTQGNYAPVDASCIVLLGVAQGQTLQIAYSFNGPSESMTKDLACEKTRDAAGLAMHTLINQAGG